MNGITFILKYITFYYQGYEGHPKPVLIFM
jgi:hypothetical protein